MGSFYILLGAILWSTGGVAVKSLAMPYLAISGARSAFSAVFFGLLLAREPRGTVREWIDTLPAAVCYCLVVVCFVLATKWTTAANAIILQYTAPLWIAILGWPALGEKPHARDLSALAAGGVGAVICMWKELSFSGGITREFIGDMVALASGLAFALVALFIRRAQRHATGDGHRHSIRLLVSGNLLAALVGSTAVLAEARAGHFAGFSLPLIAWLGIGQLGGGYYFFQKGLRTTPALRASILSLAEPVLNPVWVALAIGENPSRNTLIGGSIVLGALVINSILHASSKPEGLT